MLIGLTKKHAPTQSFLANFMAPSGNNNSHSFLRACHWMEATSDNNNSNTTGAPISMHGLGLVAETLLDELSEMNSVVAKQVNAVRRATRCRKKEIALARRSKALVSMNSFGPLAGAANFGTSLKATEDGRESPGASGNVVRGTAVSLLAPVWGLFQHTSSTSPSSGEAAPSLPAPTSPGTKHRKSKEPSKPSSIPAWMAEMEAMEEEEGLSMNGGGRAVSALEEGRSVTVNGGGGLSVQWRRKVCQCNGGGGRTVSVMEEEGSVSVMEEEERLSV